jgi:hypothetical protein
MEDRKHTTKTYGRDIAVYLAFQQKFIYAMLLVTVVGCIVMFPLHLTGSVPDTFIRSSSFAPRAGGEWWRKYLSVEPSYLEVTNSSFIDQKLPTTNEIMENPNDFMIIDRFGKFALTSDDFVVMVYTSVNMVSDSPGKMVIHLILAIFFAIVWLLVIYSWNRTLLVSKFNYGGHDNASQINYVANQVIEERLQRNMRLSDLKLEGMKDTGFKQFIDRVRLENLAMLDRWDNEFQDEDELTGGAEKIQRSNKAFLIHPYTVEVAGLPPGLTSQYEFNVMMRELVGDTEDEPNPKILKTILIYDVTRRLELERELQDCKENLDYYEYRWRVIYDSDPNKRPYARLWFVENWEAENVTSLRSRVLKKVDAIDYYTKERERIKLKIKHWNLCYRQAYMGGDMFMDYYSQQARRRRHLKYNIEGSGFGYVIFRTIQDVKECIEKFKANGFHLKYFDPKLRRQQFEGTSINKIMSVTSMSRLDLAAVADGKDEEEEEKPPQSPNDPNKTHVQGIEMIDDDDIQLDGDLKDREVKAYVGDEIDYQAENKPSQEPTTPRTPRTPRSLSKVKRFLSTDTLKSVKDQGLEKGIMPVYRALQVTIKNTRHEPQDINWPTLYRYYQVGRWEPTIRGWFLTGVLLFCFFCVSSPPAIVAGLQGVVNRILITSGAVPTTITAPATFFDTLLANFMWQWLPIFFLYISTICSLNLVAVITQLGKYKANGKMGRTQLRRLWTYMTGFNVILPTFWLASIDGLIALYYAGTLHDMFTRLYLPAAAIFFVNFLIQRTLLKGVVDMLRLQDVVLYLWYIRRRFWGKILTPMERLKAAELGDFNIEREYVFMLVTFVIIFIYSLYSPIILLCGFFYIFVKHYIDRYVVLYVYGHKAAINEMKKQGSNPTEMFKTDFSTHHKRVELVSKIFVFDIFLFFAFLAIYFGNKSITNTGFIAHCVIMAIMAALSLGIMFAMMAFYNKKKKRLRMLAGKKELRKESAAVRLAYEPPQSFLRELQYKAAHDNDSEEKIKEELKQLESMSRSKRIRQYHFRDVGCYLFNKFVPLRIICEQTLETCCNNFIDSLCGFIFL